MRLPDITIGAGAMSASFRPDAGGRMSRLTHRVFGEILVPMADGSFDPYDWPKAGAYPLFPFHSRIRGGLVHHEGRVLQLAAHPALSPDVMHGPAHRRPWQVIDHARDRLSMRLDYCADADWPFDFRAEQEFRVREGSLTIELRLVNIGALPMPGGLGWHPYFASGLRQTATSDAALSYPLDPLNLPTGEPAVHRQPGPLPEHAGYTIHLRDWSSASLTLDGGAVVTIGAGPTLPHLAVHRMPTYLCLEPVSHRAGALGSPGEALAEDVIASIAPGEYLDALIQVEIAEA
ncbi:aldose epimerase family protein [Rhizobium sp. SAFR-030]|uniref:aldose epimerase family protein n=1 Tax=Rhizobium sp. SAFR-030 TaxID=3387277 RepID=UPI003F7F8A3C